MEKSLAPMGMRHTEALPPSGLKISRMTSARSASLRWDNEVQPSSLKHMPKPSISWRGWSVLTRTSGKTSMSVTSTAASGVHQGSVSVVTTQTGSAAGSVVGSAVMRTPRVRSGFVAATGMR